VLSQLARSLLALMVRAPPRRGDIDLARVGIWWVALALPEGASVN
jgi:hypothetical protein